MKQLQIRILRSAIWLGLLFTLLFAADKICYQLALPVTIDEQYGKLSLQIGDTKLPLGQVAAPITLQLASSDKVIHEYQMDGSDSTNNFTLDQTYFHQIASSPYYLFQSWLRDLDGTSHWRDLRIQTNSHLLNALSWPSDGSSFSLPSTSSWQLSIQLQRPETSRTFNLYAANNTVLHITLDRNDRYIQVIQSASGEGDKILARVFFPTMITPFAAMVFDLIIRTLLCSILLLLAVLICEIFLALLHIPWLDLVFQRALRPMRTFVGVRHFPGGEDISSERELSFRAVSPTMSVSSQNAYIHKFTRLLRNIWCRVTASLHPLVLLALCVSLCFVAWISKVQYNGEPHIFDASAYLFAAKMYALGHLSVPLPAAADRFPGPFMLQFAGRWFAQYPPGTALTLVPGLWFGLPWLVEPLLGTLALLGIGLIVAQLYDRRVASLAVLLGTLSPFYSYLAASYLSHAIALFYLVWGLWVTLRFLRGGAYWYLLLAAFFFGMAVLTRDFVGIMYAVVTLCGLCLLSWRQIRRRWRGWYKPVALFVAIILIFCCIDLDFNVSLTGNLWETPRLLFFVGDRWGFGQGIGFYGQHTLAAGFVNLDELLTLLNIDLYGWPFYFTLAFVALPFLSWRARPADWFFLVCMIITTGAYIGYFYHGIYLGPRYLFETLPFLLVLTARGILTLGTLGYNAHKCIQVQLWRQRDAKVVTRPAKTSLTTIVLVIGLVACDLLYFLPRQLVLYTNYSGLPSSYHIDLSSVYHPPLHHAIVVTNDLILYQLVLFAMNDPFLHNDVIYASANSRAQYAELHTAYPDRVLYMINLASDGSVHYQNITNT